MIKLLLVSLLICGQDVCREDAYYDALAELYTINDCYEPSDDLSNPQFRLALYRYGLKTKIIDKGFGNYYPGFENNADTYSLLYDIRHGYAVSNKVEIPLLENLPTREEAARNSLIVQAMYSEYRDKIYPQAAPWNVDEADAILLELRQFKDVWFAMEWFHYSFEKENYHAARGYLDTIQKNLGSIYEINNYEPFAWWRIAPTIFPAK